MLYKAGILTSFKTIERCILREKYACFTNYSLPLSATMDSPEPLVAHLSQKEQDKFHNVAALHSLILSYNFIQAHLAFRDPH